MKKIRVLLVEDQAVVREGLAAILSYVSDIEVVGQAKDGIEAVEMLKETRPDVILLDLVMPRQDGLTTIPLIKEKLPEAHILVLTSFADNERVYQAIKFGAQGYMLKDATHTQLIQGIRDVAQGQATLYPSIAMRVIRELNNPTELMYTTEPLTPRELETLRLISSGLSNQEIGQKLFVQESTIAKYVSNILDKLHLANRTQAALYAVRKGITE
ncbi:MAG: response regulator transcription factor [Bacteroidetes bacterium]|jgi:two-component system, NarL family, response regulator LiaR|nr:response regulator transcription factor [Bacteroidota bacterium]MBE3140178.1 response regulator transcription factor [Thermoplasmata archaeon]